MVVGTSSSAGSTATSQSAPDAPEWVNMTDLASATFGGRVVFATDGEDSIGLVGAPHASCWAYIGRVGAIEAPGASVWTELCLWVHHAAVWKPLEIAEPQGSSISCTCSERPRKGRGLTVNTRDYGVSTQSTYFLY